MLKDVITLNDAQFYRDLELPQLNPESLDDSIIAMNEMIATLKVGSRQAETQETNILHKFGHILERVCKITTPFIKIFLAVGVQGSAVNFMAVTNFV
jgi:hypothetical protein